MADSDVLALDEDPDDVEPIGVLPAAVASDPDSGRTSQLLLLPPVDRFDRSAEPYPASRLDLDERDDALPLDHQIDIAMAGAESALHHSPPPRPEPPLRDALSQLAERLRGR